MTNEKQCYTLINKLYDNDNITIEERILLTSFIDKSLLRKERDSLAIHNIFKEIKKEKKERKGIITDSETFDPFKAAAKTILENPLYSHPGCFWNHGPWNI